MFKRFVLLMTAVALVSGNAMIAQAQTPPPKASPLAAQQGANPAPAEKQPTSAEKDKSKKKDDKKKTDKSSSESGQTKQP
jgi:hypothetical protein